MKQGQIILIRHGQTQWNKLKYIGWEDVPLDDSGRQQAEEVNRRLRKEAVDLIYSSPLIRALDTIRPFARERNLEIYPSDDLRELCYGNMQGRLKSEKKIYVKQDHRYTPVSGGESIFDLYVRVKKFVEGLSNDLCSGRNVIIVGHYLMNQILYMVLFGISFDMDLNQVTYKPRHGSLLKLRYGVDGGNGVTVKHE